MFFDFTTMVPKMKCRRCFFWRSCFYSSFRAS